MSRRRRALDNGARMSRRLPPGVINNSAIKALWHAIIVRLRKRTRGIRRLAAEAEEALRVESTEAGNHVNGEEFGGAFASSMGPYWCAAATCSRKPRPKWS
ncbi:hypothetical protein V5799_009684 [Amblyomma americanum]|uniref:Uncharacterized protein n=1 Tax=Amblyomma americanum TaxID=6943 RepID=A0AAQ4F9T5_AMBAM